LKNFAFSATDSSEFQHKFVNLLKYLNSNSPDLRDLLKPELYVKVQRALGELRSKGYRTKLLNSWEGVIEWNVYGYMRYEGLSPFAHQNFPYKYYSIDQINTFMLPTRMEFKLDKRVLFEDKIGTEVVKYENPYDIRGLPKESLHLHNLLEKFPVSIISADIGLLSKNKFIIIDLYSQQAVVEGEKSGDEYEFHIIKFEKVFPKHQERYEKEVEYQRFMDTNFKFEQFNWIISDIDQYMTYLPISN
jgi:hypothetical protein